MDPSIKAVAGLFPATAGEAPFSSVMTGADRISTPLPRFPQDADIWPSPATARRGASLPAGTPGASPSPAMKQAAQDFEALTIGQLLQPMFDTVDTSHGPFGGGDAEAAWKPLLVDAIARQFAARGGLGFAQPVFQTLLRAQETQAGKPIS